MKANRWTSAIACGTAVFVLAGCAGQKTHNTPVAKTAPARQQKLDREKQLATLRARLARSQDLSKKDTQAIPILLGASDRALSQAKAMRERMSKSKDAKERQALAKQAQEAQQLADAKAEQVVATRQDLYNQLATAADLQKQIGGLSGQDETASSVASSEEAGGKRGKRSSARLAQKHHRPGM